MSLVLRQATAADKDFIVTAITEAEKSGSGRISYCSIFSITEEYFRSVLGNILDEEMPGQELYLPGFLVAEVDGRLAAASCSWIEKADGMASNMIKSNLLMYFMERTVMLNAMPSMAVVNEVNIERDENALQIESIYTGENFRGRRLTKLLIDEHIRQKQVTGGKFDKAQIILMGHNTSAIKAYEKAGFVIKQKKTSANPEIVRLLSGDTKVLMERSLAESEGKFR